MFAKLYDSNNEKFSLNVTIKCNGEKTFGVIAEDNGKPNSEYANRELKINGSRTIYLSFPVSPKQLQIKIWNCNDANDNDFTVEFEKKELKTYDIWTDEETREFLTLCIHFSQVCGFERASQKGRIFTTEDKKFIIKFFDVITDVASGKKLSTPARIGHNTGIIETAKYKFDNYTIPMRVIILLHEFSHKYKNPKLGLDVSNEIGADVNALYIYLGLGFSKIDAICVFANVFLKAQTKGNIERMRKIMDYIQKFESGQFAKPNLVPEYV
jgi:hypothetical protein